MYDKGVLVITIKLDYPKVPRYYFSKVPSTGTAVLLKKYRGHHW